MTALEELREGLREAARRDVEVKRVRSRRRRATGLVALALLGGAAAAGAADLISVGEPVHEPPERVSSYKPEGATDLQIALTASSGGKLPFGAMTYTARNGDRCVIVGVIRGAQLGLLSGGKFRPFPSDRTGSCRQGTSEFHDFAHVDGRALLYGRAAPSTRFVRLGRTGTRTPVGAGGAFLFVFDARPTDTRVVIVEE